jgi:nucleolar pre-ribosomal-associated protein 2
LLAHISGFAACTSLGQALLESSVSPKDRQLLIEELKHVARKSQTSEQLSVLKEVIPNAQDASTQGITILQNALSAVSRDSIAKDSQEIHALYLRLLSTLRQTSDYATYTAAISCLITIIRDKPFILNQHLTEATLQAIQTLARSSPAERLVYLDLCSILSALLLHHRARLQGRFHLLISTLQTLQTRLFVPTRPATDPDRRILAPRHARAYTRLLTLLCNPPTRTHNNSSGAASSKNNTSNLIDESRRARAHVGQYAPVLLHDFCAQILVGTLAEGVRESLTPGLWAVIEAMEVQSPDAMKALSAGMNNSERAVLRSVYDDWKRFGKWEGA